MLHWSGWIESVTCAKTKRPVFIRYCDWLKSEQAIPIKCVTSIYSHKILIMNILKNINHS